MSREAMKLALEALKQIDEAMPFPVAKLAQAALREALAEQPAQQEPVAWVTGLHAGRCVIKTINPAAILPVGIALYTSPQPAQRTWVGLTDEEIARIVSLAGFAPDWVEAHIATQIVRVLEAKLKEKNT